MGGLEGQEEVIRKIKKYKISVRPFGVLRHLKKKHAVDPGKEPEDKVLESEISKVQTHLQPCALYATFSQKETPEPLKVLWRSASENSFSMSVILATIGKNIEGEMDKISKAGNPFQSALLDAITKESFEQSFQFVARLINEEALDESCELTPLLPVEEGNFRDALGVLEAHKAEISVNDSGIVSPIFTGIRYCFWTPVKGKTK